MELYLNGQDISEFKTALVKEGQLVGLKTYDVGPEEHLKTLQTFLKEQGAVAEDLVKLFVVVGPGSPTALRSILSIVNTMKFVLGVELVAVKKEKDEDDSSAFDRAGDGSVSETFLAPIYVHPPRITLSTKDALGRKK